MRRALIVLVCSILFVAPAFAVPGSPVGGGSSSTNPASTILDNVAGPTAAQAYGSLDIVNADITVLLPTGVDGMNICVLDSGTAHDIIVDVQATDNIVLLGTEGAAGVGITNASGTSTGDGVCLVAKGSKWHVMGTRGTWVSQ